jgi:large repetitive protein
MHANRSGGRLLAAVGSLGLLVALQAAQPGYAAPAAPPGSPAGARPAPPAPSPPPQPAVPEKQVGADGKPRLDLRDHHFAAAGSRQVPTLDQQLERFDNPDGTHTLRVGLGALTGTDEAGAPGDIDLALVAGGDGRLRPNRQATPVSIAATSGGRMASVELAPGRSVDLDVDGIRGGVSSRRRPDPLGEVAHFDRALPEGASLEMRARTDGVETIYVVGRAGAAANLVEHLTLPAGYSARQAGEHVELLDERGAVAGVWSGGEATDSSPHQPDTAVRLKLQGGGGRQLTAQVVVDPRWLADPGRVYPVRIDPVVVREYSNQYGCGGRPRRRHRSQGSPHRQGR